MHRFLRSIGFRQLKDQPEEWELLRRVQRKPDHIRRVKLGEDCVRETISKSFGPGMGITVSGLRYKGRFHREFYYPYVNSDCVLPVKHCLVTRQGEKEAFVGMCDESCFGISVIFYLDNFMDILEYWQGKEEQTFPVCGVCFSGLANEGKILLPIQKTLSERVTMRLMEQVKIEMLERARQGDEVALGCLTSDDMHLYERISKCIGTDDLYTMIDTTFVPTGVECDRYGVVGEILSVKLEKNSLTGEEIYLMELQCHRVKLTVAINREHLLGKPEVGRRFKGEIWLQGRLFL